MQCKASRGPGKTYREETYLRTDLSWKCDLVETKVLKKIQKAKVSLKPALKEHLEQQQLINYKLFT